MTETETQIKVTDRTAEFKKRTVNPEDEIFWHEIREAFHHVERNAGLQITVEKLGRKAVLVAASDAILISIEFVEPDAPKLIVPA